MLKIASHTFVLAITCFVLAACSATRHRQVVGPGGQMNTRINCRTRTPFKCSLRAQEVCGTYSVVEPLHLDPEDSIESTMVVHCNPSAPAMPPPPGDGGA
jgi:hypothetical protein